MDESFLKREAYIRYAGILLTLSPIGNFLWSAAYSGIHRWYRPRILMHLFAHVPAVLCVLWSLTFLAGVLMLKGKRSSWNFTLVILGANFVFSMATFKSDIRGGWLQPTLSLLIDLGLFVLVYIQEFHQRFESAARNAAQAARAARSGAVSRPLALTVRFELPVLFQDQGSETAWARITEVTHAGFRVRSLDGDGPRQIEFRTVEIDLARGLALRARFSAKIGPDFVFRFTDMDPRKLALLHQWARDVSSRGSRDPAGAAPVGRWTKPAAPGKAA